MELENKTDMTVPESGQLVLNQRTGIYPINGNHTRVLFPKGTYNLQQGSLSCTGCPHDGNHLILCNLKVNTFQYLQISI